MKKGKVQNRELLKLELEKFCFNLVTNHLGDGERGSASWRWRVSHVKHSVGEGSSSLVEDEIVDESARVIHR